MAIRFRLMRNVIRNDKNYGKYYARTVKNTEINLEDIELEIQENCTAKASDVRLVIKELYETIRRAMQNGHVVNMGELGKMYIAVTSKPVDTPDEFLTSKNITGFRCKYIPFGKRYGTACGDKARKIRRFLTEGCKANKSV
ncbi:hypothetical protein [Prevotella sp. OH937_COT-195]|uniref:HU family DNA-binding protein n=1 Tax=Prevotella sp. OH937_COT-195 TaxID=2491051 RepID=UPI000F64B891|nr:hypothetical protein [Prevotella sp. OH937_COT-195]RRC97892.1 hypothetical protein EII32_09895 [Prevotella sp. OH937_COT-195]